MSLFDALMHCFFKTVVHTVMRPLRNQAFTSTRKAKISDTEREALSSGSVGFEQDILGGRPHWQSLLDLPRTELTADELAFINGPVNELCDMLDDWQIRTETKDLPPDVWAFMKKNRFFGMIIPKEYDGLGFSARAHSEVILKLGSRSTTASVSAMVPNSLGPAELLMRYGTDEQKTYYLPRLARGEEIPSFALTEPEAGSDASGMGSHGVVCQRDGKLGILLHWEKRYITLAPITTLLGLAFKLHDPDNLLGQNKTEWGITLALIPVSQTDVDPKDAAHQPEEIIQTGRRHNPLGIPFHNGPTRGKNVWIPIENIIGGQAYAGQGWRMLMECLSVGRSVSLPALSTGSAKLVCRMAGAYSRIRKQFKVSIGQFEGVEELLARIAGTTYMMDAARITTLHMLDRGEHPTILSAVLKYHMTESGRQIVNDGMDILGGKAICEGPGNLIGPLYHGIPIGITVEGANILTRNMIIFGQGSVRSHPFILKELEAAKLDDPNEAINTFSDLMARHVQNSTINGILGTFYALTSGHFSPLPRCLPSQKRYFQHLNRLSAAYATVADMTLMLLGDSVKRKERISALLGDTLSYLYLTACVLREFNTRHGLANEYTGVSIKDELPLMDWACQTMLYQAEESMMRLLQNFPNVWMGRGLALLLFPRGQRCKPPKHRLERKVAQSILNPSAMRDRLTHGIFLPEHDSEPLTQMEQCLTHVIAAEAIERKIRDGKKAGTLTEKSSNALLKQAIDTGVISAADAQLLETTERLRRHIIDVDDFDSNLGSPPAPKLAIADGKSLRNQYPIGTRWNIELPHTDLVQFMAETWQKYANHACLDFLGKKYTYQELSQLIDKATAGLQGMGVTRGTKIGLYMPNTPYYPILFFAALKAGATVVNVCPMNTLPELRAQAKDSGMTILVTLDLKEHFENASQLCEEGTVSQLVLCRMEEMLPFFKAHAYRILRASHIAKTEDSKASITSFKELTQSNRSVIAVSLNPEDIAVLQYTGGTTGSPKGAMLSHANLVANILQIEEYFKASADKPSSHSLIRAGKERVLSSIPYFHIFGMTVSMLSNLRMGGELLILPDPRNTKEALKTIQEKKATLFPAVPRLLQALSEHPRTKMTDLSQLQTVISGGAALPDNIKTSFETASQTQGVIKQGYGLTETSPVVASNPPYGLNKPESVGLPIPRTAIKITDPDNPNRTLMIGEVGEICIQGPQVMKGYYNRPEETAEALHNGWLRTGDLGYLDADYYLHIVDRKKRLILVNGFNVYPTQIEHAISQHPSVAECMVICVSDPRSGEAAKAFIRLKHPHSHPCSIQQMQAFLSETLSRSEMPKYIEFVHEELPKTSVGKPDWKRMQEREQLKSVAFGCVELDPASHQHPPFEAEQAS